MFGSVRRLQRVLLLSHLLQRPCQFTGVNKKYKQKWHLALYCIDFNAMFLSNFIRDQGGSHPVFVNPM
jgi:hypothetical protein